MFADPCMNDADTDDDPFDVGKISGTLYRITCVMMTSHFFTSETGEPLVTLGLL